MPCPSVMLENILGLSKGAGPDNLLSKTLKYCVTELSRIFTYIFNLTFKIGQVPKLWKKSKIILASQRPVTKCMKDLRPISLTAVPMKVCERLFLKHLKPLVVHSLETLQFVYNTNRCCEDVILVQQHLYPHLEHSGSSARVMFL